MIYRFIQSLGIRKLKVLKMHIGVTKSNKETATVLDRMPTMQILRLSAQVKGSNK